MPRQFVNEVVSPGSIVYLLSGGPAMTVVSVAQSGLAECFWFDSNAQLQKGQFPVFLLTNTKPE